MGEKFSANPVTGTGSLSVPIYTSPGRSGFGPRLSLSYDSGAGNGPFGWGWSLSIPSITRKTEKGLPRYRDAEESDVFVLSGAEDLVPALKEVNGQWEPDVVSRKLGDDDYRVHRYRPRVEGLFARIERWTRRHDGDTHWRSISKDNIITLYGKTSESRIADPADPSRVFSWLICESYDDKGNAILYEYLPEDSAGVDPYLVNERNRTDASRSANRYLKHVKYGNRTPRELGEDLTQRTDWLFEVVLDYGEHDPAEPTSNDEGEWLCRHDPFSSYRAGFEVRTYRLCQRALMFHHFPDEEEVGQDCLVRSTDFVYRDIRGNPEDLKKGHPIASFIASAVQSGYRRQSDGSYLKKSLPPLEFEYSKATIQDEVREVDPESLENLPYGLDGTRYQWTDLDGEGISGILTEQAGAWLYKRNISPVALERQDGQETAVARFAPAELVGQKPSLSEENSGRGQFLDLAGDGSLDLVRFEHPAPGFYERTDDGWNVFISFSSLPQLDWDDPNLRFVDLTGDGHADVLITEDEVFAWYPSLAEAGFGEGERLRQSADEEKGPRLVFADGTQSVYLADISGDGLTDLVRIRNGEVCYWPNLGYGRFGARVAMDNAPWFDSPDQFDQQRIHLADIDGSGVTDIIYLGLDGARLYFNQSGNSWGEAHRLASFPRTDNLSSVTALDLLGNGTACLVWSSPLPGDTRQPMRYVAVMGGQKPHLMLKVVNNLGAETHVRYAPSTRFYLADKAAGRPWITRLPFPVHVVERVETYDRIGRNRFVTRYAYHHGYFDGAEREFRGFGMVEQWDTEELTALSANGKFPDATNIDEASHVPPVLTRTWFHTGAYLDGSRISRQFEQEYYRESDLGEGLPGLSDEQLQAMLLDDTILPATWSLEEAHEACRALRGSILRQEAYALDGAEEADRPYSVSERNYALRQLQPRGENKHAVFFAHPRETIDFHYERKLFDVGGSKRADPRVTHSMTLDVDDFGNVRQSAAIGYGRRYDDPDPLLNSDDRNKQMRTLVTYTENRYTNAVLEEDTYRTPLSCETQTYELLKVVPSSSQPNVTNLFRFDEIRSRVQEAGDGDHDLPYEDVAATGATENHPYRRLIEIVRTLYRRNDLTGPLPLRQLQSRALTYESYRLAFTPGLLDQTFVSSGKTTTTELRDTLQNEGRYASSASLKASGLFPATDADGWWWIPSGQVFYSPNVGDTAAQEFAFAQVHFFLPHRFRDPFGATTRISYDAPYNLLVLETEDHLHNRVTAGERHPGNDVTPRNDYRVLQPKLVTDPNGNRAKVAFDTLGMVVATAVMGKLGENVGDSLDDFVPDLDEATVLAQLQSPLSNPHSILRRATTRLVYDLYAYHRTKGSTQPQPNVVYTLARETHDADLAQGELTRIQHSFSYSDGFGRQIQKKIQAEPGPLVEGGPVINLRWAGSGWTIFNNKGKPVRQYEPFFSATHKFEFVNLVGVSLILFYDPVDREVATLYPNDTYKKVVFDPWQQTTWDVNDTVLHTDPKDDADVGDFFRRLLKDEDLDTWYEQRITGEYGDTPEQQKAEKQAAENTAKHAGTPTVAYFDTLGRPFLTVAHNRFERNGATLNERYATRVHLDIEGNQREVVDAQNRIVMGYAYDMLGNQIKQASMDASSRWMLNDVAGKPIYTWDGRDHRVRRTYDGLQRPVGVYVRQGAGNEALVERTVYGEAHPDSNPPATGKLNLRGNVFMQLDGAGVIINVARNPQGEDEAYDFKGNLKRSRRRLAREYKQQTNWQALEPLVNVVPPAVLNLAGIESSLARSLETPTFTSGTTYDALNRPVTLTAPDHSVVRSTYNEASLLDGVKANLRGAATTTTFVRNIDYDARGQRKRIEYGNSVFTEYAYDEDTFRLVHLKTTRPTFPAAERTVQDLRYTYDPVGNITHIEDDADIQNVVFFRNRRVEPSADYVYDAVYRLIEATGREHLGQTNDKKPRPPTPTSPTDAPRVGLGHPGDGQAMGRYTETYQYDQVGNIARVVHTAISGGWTRSYAYDEPSLIEQAKTNNRLSATTVGNQTVSYSHDAHGNMTRMPHLPLMRWDHEDQLQATSKQVVGGGGTPETTYYVYDSTGQRMRKVTERQATAGKKPTRKQERIYFGGFEIYREYGGDGVSVVLERETLYVMDDRRRVAMVETKTRNQGKSVASSTPRIRHQLDNHLGSACVELDGKAAVITYEEYHPYGSTSYQAVRSGVEVSAKRYRYTGKERDEESGLYYHGARYCAPWLGRWTSCDPAGTKDGTNLYQYVRSHPTRLVDEHGTSSGPPNLVSSGVPAEAVGPLNLAEDQTIRNVAEKVWNRLRTPNFENFSKNMHKAIKQIVRGQTAHPLKDLLEIGKNGRLVFKAGPFKGQFLEFAHDVSQAQIKAQGLNRWLAVDPRNLFAVGDKFHDEWLHVRDVATEWGQKMTIADEGLKQYVPAVPRAAQSAASVKAPIGVAPKNAGFVSVGGALTILGVTVSTVQVARGVEQIAGGETALGTIDVAEGSTNLGMTLGAPAAVKSGAIAAGGGGLAMLGAGIAAGGGVALAAETARAAVKGEKTPVEIADEYYGTDFGDLYGWSQRSSLVPAVVKQQQKATMEFLQDAYYRLFLK